MNRRAANGGGSRREEGMRPAEAEPLLTLRAAVLLALATFAGLLVGGLSHAAGVSTAAAFLAGVTAFAGSVTALHRLIGR